MLKVSKNNRVVEIVLNRPEVRNALNREMILKLTEAFKDVSKSKDVLVVVVKGAGKSFCSGADLNYMRSFINSSREENVEDATILSNLFETIDKCPHPIIAKVHGAASGGGIGIVSLCDIVACEIQTKFLFAEAKVGIVPSVISSYVLFKLGYSSAMELMLTGDTFDATTALNKNLVHFVGNDLQVDEYILKKIDSFNNVGYSATRHTKRLIKKINRHSIPDDLKNYCIELIADVRVSEEARKGIESFFKKRK